MTSIRSRYSRRALAIHRSAMAFAERRGELGVPVPHEEFEAVSVIVQVHQQVASLLGRPLPRRVGGDPGQVHAAGAVPDEEQDVQAAQEHRIDVEEVRRQDRLSLGRPVRRGCAGSPSPGCPGHLQHQRPHGRQGPRPSWGPVRVRPVPPARSACQRSTVREETIRRRRRSWLPGRSRASAARTARPAHDSRGTTTCRWNTAT